MQAFHLPGLVMLSRAHDASYKQLFNSPLMVRHLLRGHLPHAVLGELDDAIIEPVPTGFIGPGLRTRHSDQIWRVRLNDGSLREAYVMLEFQSRYDPAMALRTCIYSALLYEALLQSNNLKPAGLWPPVLCFVLYNGKRRWRGSTQLHDRIWRHGPGPLRCGWLQHRFVLVDMHGQMLQNTKKENNLVALLMRFERDLPPSEFVELLGKLDQQLPHTGEIRHQFARWIVEKVGQGSEWAQMAHDLLLEKGTTMDWAQRVSKWEKGFERKGRKEGLRLGRLEGKQEGKQEGKLEGKIEMLQSTLREILTKRFGPLDADTQDRIQSAQLEQLKNWIMRVLDAATVSDVFELKH
jgi:predicted transposase YdaD